MTVARLSRRSIVLLAAVRLVAACSDGDDQATIQLAVSGRGADAIAMSFRARCAAGSCDSVARCTASDGACSFEVEASSTVRLEARPGSGRRFVAWSGACAPVTGFPDSATVVLNPHEVAQCEGAFGPVVTAGCSNPVVIEDDFEVDAGWTYLVSSSTPGPDSTLTVVVARQATGGSPGGYRQMQHVFNSGGSLSVYHAFEAAYDPSTQGTIDHINYYEDQILLDPPFVGAFIEPGFTMRQAGVLTTFVVRPPTGRFSNTVWERTPVLALTASSVAPGVDFTGGPITFGYARFSTNTGLDRYTITHGIDNFRVEICR